MSNAFSLDCVLAADVGTTGLKCTIVSRTGAIVASAYQEYERGTTVGEDARFVEQEPGDWWDAFRGCVASLQESAREPLGAVAAVVLSGQMQDLILVDEDYTALRPAILYSDARAQQEARHVEDCHGVEALQDLTGNWKGAFSLLPKLMWVASHEPSRLARCKRVLFGAHDYLCARLCGNAVTDYVTASTTGLTCVDGDSEESMTVSYCRSLISEHCLAAVPLLPALLRADQPAGILLHDDLGFSPGIPVFHGCGDAGATTLGAGAGTLGSPAYMYLGTSGWIAQTRSCAPATPKCLDPARSQGHFHLAHPYNERLRVAGLSCLVAGGNVEWLRAVFHPDDLTASAGYEAINDAAGESPRGARGVVYLPWLAGERAPICDPDARACFLGISAATTQADLQRAVLEGVAYGFRLLADNAFPELETIRVLGGGARSQVWMQIMADVLGCEVQAVADPANAGARGAATLAWDHLGWGEQERAGNGVPVAAVYRPDPEAASVYQPLYMAFSHAHAALKPLFSHLARFRSQAATARKRDT